MSPSQDSEFPEPDSMTVDPANLGSVDPLSIEGIFLAALSKSGTEREAFLSLQCADSSQRQRVTALLVAYEQAGNFLQQPAVAVEPAPIGQYLASCDSPGTLGRLGLYEILEEIGRGGMGVVFRAYDPKLQRIVAVKALAPELARLPSARQRFLREARAAAAVSHPHVVTIFAVEGTEEASLGTERTTLPFLVMECIVGQTLHDKIKRVGALKFEEIVRISRQIAEGLTAAHKRGLIHRDIKPANILLENGVERVKITDFGLARTTSDGGITHTGEILGTPQCMSPEQARGEIVDQRSDLFSLGCVMYTMCTGFSPFRADNMLAVMKKVCEETPRPIAQINPNIPEWLCELVHRLLEKEPERRVQKAEGVVQVLESRVDNSPRGAAQSPPKPPLASLPEEDAKEIWWNSQLPDIAAISFLLAMLQGAIYADVADVEPFLTGLLVWAAAYLFRIVCKCGRWINRQNFVVSLLAIIPGGILGVLIRQKGGYFELGTPVFVFSSASIIFWLLTRWFPQLFIQNRPTAAQQIAAPSPAASGFGLTTKSLVFVALCAAGIAIHQGLSISSSGSKQTSALLIFFLLIALMFWLIIKLGAIVVRRTRALDVVRASALATPQAAQRARTPWILLEWIIVGTLGIAVLSSLGFATVWIMSYLPAPDEIGPRAYCVIRTPVAENVKYITIDGKQAKLEPGGPGEWRTTTPQGIREIYVAYDSDSVLNQERFFTTTANVAPGRTTVITAEPVMVRSLIRPPGIEAPMSVQTGRMRIPAAIPSDQTSTGLPINHDAIPTEVTASIPLADAVEVLSDPTTMPAPPFELFTGTVQGVWIDEPGLLVRLKRFDFEGTEKNGEEFYTKATWGTGTFLRSKDDEQLGVNPIQQVGVELLPGRYSVLVQDLDYGWPLDRRGTITLGSGPQYIHVKRSFDSHWLRSDGDTQFPVPFRWAGKTYQIQTPQEVQFVNTLLLLLSKGDGSEGTAKDTDTQSMIAGFSDQHFVAEAIEIDAQSGSARLKRERTLAQIDIQSANVLAGFMSPLGRLEWKGPHKSPQGVFVPRQELRMFVKDELIGWDTLAWYDNQPIATDDPLATPLVARRDRAFIKKFAETEPPKSPVVNLWFQWFGTNPDLPRKSAPAIRRLISAWADGQPDVPEAELLQLGGATTLEELFIRPTSGNAAPAVTGDKVEPKTEESNTEFVPPAFLVPGSTPGTWRMKEPPDGAVTPN
jgi:serine/threonine protein kinase